MGMIGRQKRALKFELSPSPSTTLSMTPALAGDLGQPSYFSLSRKTSHSREHSRATSDNHSNSADSDVLQAMFRR
jgi:serine/threonine-protein kinase RIM15